MTDPAPRRHVDVRVRLRVLVTVDPWVGQAALDRVGEQEIARLTVGALRLAPASPAGWLDDDNPFYVEDLTDVEVLP